MGRSGRNILPGLLSRPILATTVPPPKSRKNRGFKHKGREKSRVLVRIRGYLRGLARGKTHTCTSTDSDRLHQIAFSLDRLWEKHIVLQVNMPVQITLEIFETRIQTLETRARVGRCRVVG